MTQRAIYKLVARALRRPHVRSGAFPVGYFQDHFNGTPLPEGWLAPPHELHGASYRLADAVAWKEPFPLLSPRAVEVLEAVAPGCAEYRFFSEIKGVPYYVVNVLAIADPAISAECPTLFRRPGPGLSDTFCVEDVPAAVVHHRLTGFCFRDPFQSEVKDLFYGKDTNVYPGVLA